MTDHQPPTHHPDDIPALDLSLGILDDLLQVWPRQIGALSGELVLSTFVPVDDLALCLRTKLYGRYRWSFTGEDLVGLLARVGLYPNTNRELYHTAVVADAAARHPFTLDEYALANWWRQTTDTSVEHPLTVSELYEGDVAKFVTELLVDSHAVTNEHRWVPTLEELADIEGEPGGMILHIARVGWPTGLRVGAEMTKDDLDGGMEDCDPVRAALWVVDLLNRLTGEFHHYVIGRGQ